MERRSLGFGWRSAEECPQPAAKANGIEARLNEHLPNISGLGFQLGQQLGSIFPRRSQYILDRQIAQFAQAEQQVRRLNQDRAARVRFGFGEGQDQDDTVRVLGHGGLIRFVCAWKNASPSSRSVDHLAGSGRFRERIVPDELPQP